MPEMRWFISAGLQVRLDYVIWISTIHLVLCPLLEDTTGQAESDTTLAKTYP
jgi:hypothetical protein